MKFLTLMGETAEFRRRYRWMGAFATLVFLGLLARLFWLQVAKGDDYFAQSEQNFVRERPLPFARGVIRDRASRAVATNRPSNDVYVTPSHVCGEAMRLAEPEASALAGPDDCPLERSKTLPLLSDFLDLTPEETTALERRIRKATGRRRDQQFVARRDIDRGELARLETHHEELAGVDVVTVPARQYPFGEAGAHAVGFLNEVSAEELEDCPPLAAGAGAAGKNAPRGPCGLAERGYRPGDVVGRAGVERAFESYLRGKRGWKRVVIDANGRTQTGPEADALLRGPDRLDPVAGHDVDLTLDLELTRTVDRAFRGQPAGAAVVVEVQTGRVLALYSKPSFDSNVLSGRMTGAQSEELSQNPFRPLIDKTLYEMYFPGSTYKIVTAIAALEEGLVTPEELIHCQGWHELGRRTFRCSQPHGNVNMLDAIVQSCNVYFYRLAERVGMDKIALHAADLGFGVPTGIGLPGDSPGRIPTRRWYEEHRERLGQFVQGFTLNAAIGQGSTKVTLLQLAMAYAAVANGGVMYVPQVVREIRRPDGAVVPDLDFRPRVRRRIAATREHLALLQRGLWGVVNDPLGTAYEYRIDGVDASGKTGTAQVARRPLKRGDDPRRAWYYNRDHAWFVGYAPSDAPEVAAVVLVEHGGQGGKNAAPIGLRILRDYLDKTRPAAAAPRLAAPAPQPRTRRPNPASGTSPASTR